MYIKNILRATALTFSLTGAFAGGDTEFNEYEFTGTTGQNPGRDAVVFHQSVQALIPAEERIDFFKLAADKELTGFVTTTTQSFAPGQDAFFLLSQWNYLPAALPVNVKNTWGERIKASWAQTHAISLENSLKFIESAWDESNDSADQLLGEFMQEYVNNHQATLVQDLTSIMAEKFDTYQKSLMQILTRVQNTPDSGIEIERNEANQTAKVRISKSKQFRADLKEASKPVEEAAKPVLAAIVGGEEIRKEISHNIRSEARKVFKKWKK